jgi:hypothetical protein
MRVPSALTPNGANGGADHIARIPGEATRAAGATVDLFVGTDFFLTEPEAWSGCSNSAGFRKATAMTIASAFWMSFGDDPGVVGVGRVRDEHLFASGSVAPGVDDALIAQFS